MALPQHQYELRDGGYHHENNISIGQEEMDTPCIETESLTNIYLMTWNCNTEFMNDDEIPQQSITLSFGKCDMGNQSNIGDEVKKMKPHHIIGTTTNNSGSSSPFQQLNQYYCQQQRQFVWAVPSLNTLGVHQGCLFATHNPSGRILAKSKQYTVLPSKKWTTKGEGKSNDEQQEEPQLFGLYFDGATYFKKMMAKKNNMNSQKDDFMEVEPLAAKKEKKIGVIGAGASGLFSTYLLKQAGYKNVEIIEGNNRVGGRIKTAYFDHSKTIYNELGAMRIPIAWKYKNQTMLSIQEHKIIFQIAEELNKINNKEDKIEFIPFIDINENNMEYFNGFRLPDGRVPTRKDILKQTGTLYIHLEDPNDIPQEAHEIFQPFENDEKIKSLSQDFYGTFKNAMLTMNDQWSEREWLYREMNASTAAVDYEIQWKNGRDVWYFMYSSLFMSEKCTFRTIHGGMSRLPEGLRLALGDKKIITYNTPISKIEFIKDHKEDQNDDATTTTSKKISAQWKNNPFDKTYNSKKFDSMIISVPFAVVRSWHLPPEIPYILKSAIRYLQDGTACKVLLEFKTRFWEHDQDRPIFGGCGDTDLPMTYTCYPSNDLGSEGPAVMIASYVQDDFIHFGSLSDEEHVARILEDVAEIHGEIVYDQYTGKYARQCWGQDPFARTAWAMYTAAHRRLYLPSYYEYLDGLIFVGEHTHIYQDWISSALHSAIRGVIMVLIEHGDIDGAKAIANYWHDTLYIHI
ncbi:flavin-containing amine oxidoreductase-domain containing protein [Phascolomyces articulosus]|uniref:Flavin-containing amine oxidoreductase-domain containing protein n=1 Tax=Phascolomyces articulosus TaxID=60185 RepID=A0AAD5PJQ7_9FUNG|nr:flavin-containing amine oxidoreductase-domain containing protein [Phascolomyces articulosus]